MEEGAGLPTYSKDRAEGEKVLESGAAAKEDEEDDRETASDHERNVVDQIRGSGVERNLEAPGEEQISPRTEEGNRGS